MYTPAVLAASCVARHLTVPWYVLPQHYFDAAALLHGAPWSDICLRLPAAALRSTRRICKNRAQPHDSRLRSPATALVRKLYNIVTRRRSSMQHDHTLQYYGQLDISSCRCSEIVVTCNRRRAPSRLTSFCQRCGFNSTLQCFHRNAAAARWRLSFITESTRLLQHKQIGKQDTVLLGSIIFQSLCSARLALCTIARLATCLWLQIHDSRK